MSIERKYKWTKNEPKMVTEQNPQIVPHDNIESSNMLTWLLNVPICNFSVIRITNIWMQQQIQDIQNIRVW